MYDEKIAWQKTFRIHNMWNKLNERKIRLFLLVLCNDMPQSLNNLSAMKVAEDYIDGKNMNALREEHRKLVEYCWEYYEDTGMYDPQSELVKCLCAWKLDHEEILGRCMNLRTSNKQAMIIRDICNPFSPNFDHNWLTFDVMAIARSIYETQDYSIFPVLGDALEDAGCENSEILHHCRNSVLHWKGNWLIDYLLSKGGD